MSSVDFSSILNDFVAGDLEKNSIWLVYTAVIIETVSSAKHIDELWSYIASEEKDADKLLTIARRLREGLLKTSVLAGLPRGINCLAALRDSLNGTSPNVGKKYEADKSLRAAYTAPELEKRGTAFFNRVYSKVASRVQESMALSSGGDLDEFVILSIYGKLMAEESILDARETGLMEFVVCYVSSVAPQAKGHLYGSRNLGNGKEEILKAVKLAQVLAKALNVPVDTESMGFVEKVQGW